MPTHDLARQRARQPHPDPLDDWDNPWHRPCAGCLGEGKLWQVGKRWLCADCLGERSELPPLPSEAA
jgi:hypothetical protein